MEEIPEVILNSGWKIPLLGFGTAAHPIPPSDLIQSSIFSAMELGYRHFDTASAYQSEAPLGRAISEAISGGLIADRNQLFITSKLWCSDAHHDLVVPALRRTLRYSYNRYFMYVNEVMYDVYAIHCRTLGLEYLDLYLIHWPVRLKSQIELSFDVAEEDMLPFDVRGTWEAMEECQRLGLTRSIGVCNFSIELLSELLAHAKIPPAVNQVEMHPYWQQHELRKFCIDNHIHVSAYSPLGGKGAFWGSNIILDSKVIQEIAQAKGKSIAQVCLRWAYQQGVSFLPKSYNKGRMKENMEIFDWQLNGEDLQIISGLPQQKISSGPKVVSKDK